MQNNWTLLLPVLFLVNCVGYPPSSPPVTAPAPTPKISPTADDFAWNTYDPKPDHLWNRMFRQFYRRVSKDGKEYGLDELDPLLWYDTTYLLHEDSYQHSIQILDGFLQTHGEDLVDDPLKRAFLQRDLWAVFDWLAFQPEPYPAQRRALQVRIAQVIKRVALTKDEILSLPDNYALAVSSGMFPGDFQAENPEAAFLPVDLFHANHAWVPLGREGGPIAMSHTREFPFLGRSVFLVFVRSPGGQTATLNFIESLNKRPQSVLTTGLDVALVRRMLLIDEQGELVLSPLIETIQIRHFNPQQIFHEFELSRKHLFAGLAGGLLLNEELFLLFFSHGDVFQFGDISKLQATVPEICKGCHFENLPLPNSSNTQSILSYSRENFPLQDDEQPLLHSTTWTNEAQIVIEWKHNHQTWQTLEALWKQQNP